MEVAGASAAEAFAVEAPGWPRQPELVPAELSVMAPVCPGPMVAEFDWPLLPCPCRLKSLHSTGQEWTRWSENAPFCQHIAGHSLPAASWSRHRRAPNHVTLRQRGRPAMSLLRQSIFSISVLSRVTLDGTECGERLVEWIPVVAVDRVAPVGLPEPERQAPERCPPWAPAPTSPSPTPVLIPAWQGPCQPSRF